MSKAPVHNGSLSGVSTRSARMARWTE